MKRLNAELTARMFISGAANLDAAKEMINELNVFPVPDGDTGTNMTMTITSAAAAVRESDQTNMKEIATAMSRGSLRGARGNSGVILSQLTRGFCKVISEHDELTLPIIAEACERAVETAYKAVMKPKEGTILTVARGFSEKMKALCDQGERDLEQVFSKALIYANNVLDKTPEMLPVLKEAGVVDSGGKGLLTFLQGCYEEMTGTFDASKLQFTTAEPKTKVEFYPEEADIKFGYCTEFIINLDAPMPDDEVKSFKKYLTSIGDSLVLVADEDLVKIHVHTNDPGEAISRALTYSPLTNMKIDNMRVEHHEKVIHDAMRLADEQAKADAAAESEAATNETSAEHKEYGFITVCAGAGFENAFKELGADVVISGGQTMNPSTDDFLNAIKEVNADCIFIYPNNGNIILAANQAKDLTEDKKIIVIPTKTVTQGISAMVGFIHGSTPEENEESMLDAIGNVKTAQITYSVRDTTIQSIEIHKGDIMAVGDSGILCVGNSIIDTALDAVKALVDEDSTLISVYYGEDFSKEDAEALCESLEEAHPDCEVELSEGGQPVYYCILSVE